MWWPRWAMYKLKFEQLKLAHEKRGGPDYIYVSERYILLKNATQKDIEEIVNEKAI